MVAMTQEGLMEELAHFVKTERLEFVWGLVVQAQEQIAQLEHRCRILEDDLRNVRYTAEDAQRKAENAEREAQRAGRGW